MIKKAAHEFGVNSIDAKVLEDGRMVVASGGDDQQIRVMIVEAGGEKVVSEEKVYAHSSCVKGVTISRDGGQIVVSSSSYD